MRSSKILKPQRRPYEGFAYLRTLLHQKNLLTHTKQRFLSIQMLLMSIVRFFRELKNRFLALLNNESMKENLMQHQVRMICEPGSDPLSSFIGR